MSRFDALDSMYFSERVGAEIRTLRERAGLTQEELGARAGVHRNTLINYERGKDMPAMVLVRLCVAMQADVAGLLRRAMETEGAK